MLILIITTAVALLASSLADRRKTLEGLKKSYKMFLGILPMLLNVLILVSIALYLVPKETLAKWLGANSGPAGYAIAAVIGSIALIPGFVAFPLAAMLLKSGVGYAVAAVFITTLMMVGILTLPLEIKFFGRKAALMRNGLSLAGALLIGLLMRVFM
jgi:uncharacterized membrane protein YraQ (UPF0718 family)